MGKKRLLVWTVLIAAAAAAVLLAPQAAREAPVDVAAAPASARTQAPAAKTSDRLAALPSRDAIGRGAGDPFFARSWAPPPPKKTAAPPVVVAPEPPPAPSPPPMPYRVAGRVLQQGVPHIVLAKGDRVVTVREGDVLDDGYRVESIGAGGVTLVYTPLNVPQQLPIAAGLELNAPLVPRATAGPVPERASAPAERLVTAEQGAAKLRWEGPKSIRAGDAFTVALKVTSAEAVRSAPLQLSFDAELLEAVDVRRGVFFADGSFSYRINPSGSIFIGASGKGAIPADAEFFVVTFKPVRAGATAELKLSSLLLQGHAGRAIAHDQPAAFRTSILR